MSKRTSIIKAITTKLQGIDGSGTYKTNIYNAAFSKLKFWDEVTDFPCMYVVAGTETRQYLPGDFAWAYLNISIKVYVKGEEAATILEDVLEDVETVLDANRELEYNDSGNRIRDITINSIVTDEGLLAPYAIAEVNLQARYEIIQ